MGKPNRKGSSVVTMTPEMEEDMFQCKQFSLSLKDLKTIKPLNHPQVQMQTAYEQDYNIVANGSAGTGKTYFAMFLALTSLLDKRTDIEKIIIVRSAVSSRDIGHLPGSEEEKMAVYETPYSDIVGDLCGRRTAYEKFKKQNKIIFMPTSFVRGLTWDNAIVLIDEAQNLNFHEMNSIITRLGQNSRLMIMGDKIQTDLYKSSRDSSGMDKFLNVAKRAKDEHEKNIFDIVEFTTADIVRSGLVKAWIKALED